MYTRQEAQLPHRDRATRYVSKFVLYVSRDMWARKVSKSKSDLQGHSKESKALAMAPFAFDRPHSIYY